MSGVEESRNGGLPEGGGLRALVVVLEPDLHRSRITGLMLNIRDLPGVRSVTDMTAIDQTTLDYLLLRPTERVRQADKSHYNDIREYWRRKRQPGLWA